jgi:hypothetical protein
MQDQEQNTDELRSRIERLDRLIAERDDGTRGLGVRLALGLALEIRDGLAPGSTTSDLVTGWMERFGADAVDEAVLHARVLLMDPARMAEEFRKRMEPQAPAPAAEGESRDA